MLVEQLIKLKVNLSSPNRRDETLERGVRTGDKTEFMREEGSKIEAELMVLRTGFGINHWIHWSYHYRGRSRWDFLEKESPIFPMIQH